MFAFAFKIPGILNMDHAVIMSLSRKIERADALKRGNNSSQLVACGDINVKIKTNTEEGDGVRIKVQKSGHEYHYLYYKNTVFACAD